jgi:transcriptional repressor NrdR
MCPAIVNRSPSGTRREPFAPGEEKPVHCPFCRHADSRVVDSRTSDDGLSIRRRRQCPACNRRFTTVETASLSVVKRSGATEPFSREKIINGVRKACQGRPVSEDDLALLAQRVEETIRSSGSAELDAYEIGLTILDEWLGDLDRRPLRAPADGTSTGPWAAAPRTAGLRTAEPQTAGPQTAGPQTAGPQTAGPASTRSRTTRRKTLPI